MKKIEFLLFFIFFWLQYSFWFGKHGICDFFRIKNDIKIKISDNRRIELKYLNHQLFCEINNLINNQEATIEERARNDLGMIKSDEIFYRLIVIDKNINE